MNPPTLIIVRGLPGSGKTTLARLLVTMPGAVEVSADDFPGRYDFDEQGYLVFTQDKGEALSWCFEQVRRHMSNRVPVIIVHNTFITRRSVEEYVGLAARFGYRTIILRVEGRHKSIHSVPDDTIKSMAQSYEPWDGDLFASS